MSRRVWMDLGWSFSSGPDWLGGVSGVCCGMVTYQLDSLTMVHRLWRYRISASTRSL